MTVMTHKSGPGRKGKVERVEKIGAKIKWLKIKRKGGNGTEKKK